MIQQQHTDSSSIWQQASEEAEHITDKLGKKIDQGIKETVIALRACGFPTQSSCEGHLDRALPYPWVEIHANMPDQPNWHQDDDLYHDWAYENRELQKNLLNLLAKFYEASKTPFVDRLIVNSDILSFDFRLQNLGGPIIRTDPSKQNQEQKLSLYQKEMSDFARFLWEYWTLRSMH